MTTLRQHLEAIRDLHGRESHADNRYCGGCNRKWPCAQYKHATAALEILDESPRAFGKYEGRIVPDPEPDDAAKPVFP